MDGEKNNTNKGAIDALKKIGKIAMNKITNIFKTVILPKLMPVIASLVLIIIVLTVILTTVFTIINFFKNLLFGGADDDSVGSSYSVIQEVQEYITITDNGYEIKDNISQEILDGLEEQGVDTDEMELDTKKYGDMIYKYIEAEVKTMYPKIEGATSSKNIVNGGITVARLDAQSGDEKTLKYTNYSNFCNSLDLDKFSLNPDNFKLCYAQKNNEGNLEMKEVDYQSSVSAYATPFNFLISLHLITMDSEFMTDLLDMIDESDIKMVIADSSSTTTVTYDYSGFMTIYTYTQTDVSDSEVETYDLSKDNVTVDNDNANTYLNLIGEQVKENSESTTNITTFYVTRAKTWFADIEKTLTTSSNETTNKERSNNFYINETVESVNSDDNKVKKIYNGSIYEDKTEVIDTYTVSETQTQGGYNVDDFIDLIQEYDEVEDNLVSSPSLLFYLLNQNDNTQKLGEVMKYVLYCLSGIDYGVKDPNSISINGSYTSTGSHYGSSTEEKVWWAVIDAVMAHNSSLSEDDAKILAASVLGNMEQESSLRSWVFEGYESRSRDKSTLQEAYANGYIKDDISKYENLIEYFSDYESDPDNSRAYEFQHTKLINDSYYGGFGLLQIADPHPERNQKRKLGMYDYARSINKSIDDVDMQIDYMLAEIFGEPSDVFNYCYDGLRTIGRFTF